MDLPNIGDEPHHFGWNACSTALCPYAPHPHVERRYLIVPGLRSSRIHVTDTKPDPRKLEIVKTIEPQDVFKRTGYSRPHTVHCGPKGIYVSALGAPDGTGPGGIFLIDHNDFNVLGRWEVDRGPQELAYDFWWHLGHDTLISVGHALAIGLVVFVLSCLALRYRSAGCNSVAVRFFLGWVDGDCGAPGIRSWLECVSVSRI